MPHLETLRRLIQNATEPGARTVQDADVNALLARLRARQARPGS